MGVHGNIIIVKFWKFVIIKIFVIKTTGGLDKILMDKIELDNWLIFFQSFIYRTSVVC